MNAAVSDLSHLFKLHKADHIWADQVHVPQHLQSKCLGSAHPHGFTGLKSSADHSQHNSLPIYFQTSYFQTSYFTSTENSGSLIYFYYCLIRFTLSFITFPNRKSWKDFCFFHCWKHNANSLQGLQDLTSILNDSLLYLSVSSNITQNCLFKKKRVIITSCHTV